MTTVLSMTFTRNTPIKKAISKSKRDIKQLIHRYCDEKFWIDSYGAVDIDPKHLVIWICVQSDRMKDRLAVEPDLPNEIRSILIKNNYPHQSVDEVYIGIESQETVDRESDGDWYLHFK